MEWKKDFEDRFVHKGDDERESNPQEWAWKLRGHPIEVELYIDNLITTLLESLKREDMVDYNDEFDMPSDGYNQRNKELEEDINKILGI